MNTPSPRPSHPVVSPQQIAALEVQLHAWLKLRRELRELHARLEYLKLLASLGVRRTGV